MKTITRTQSYGLILKYMDLMVDISKDLPKTEIEVARAEIRMLAVLNTNHQEDYVEEWIRFLIEDIKSKL
ncbi:hypothetical protein [Escherichia phage BF17]|uniref:hypothetical protein n=1 Tax=Escherichia coli TaxID=562 RepID=UPI000A2DAC22|nr:hypothetical protein [Escherichia coli]QXN76040.1 hypothetical protein [Escherichia phage BF17]WIL00571.1 hypothetical protein [Escherichia phage vB_EcoM_CRJP21]WPK18450.1 hypothetical protein [Salmonella phage SD-2_S15]WPK19094.1 hypothetical protein [Salmonella phage SD-6_S16]WPK19768.1 hypothetical protein [Salmonella phage SD-1_S14]WPK20791.1 hypothetical protein [Salmonella phage SD-15_S21]